jgi:hypothetical protein
MHSYRRDVHYFSGETPTSAAEAGLISWAGSGTAEEVAEKHSFSRAAILRNLPSWPLLA